MYDFGTRFNFIKTYAQNTPYFRVLVRFKKIYIFLLYFRRETTFHFLSFKRLNDILSSTKNNRLEN